VQRLVLLSSDTNHHRSFLHKLRKAGFEFVHTLFETASVQAPFPTGPLFEEDQDRFEREMWNGLLTLDGLVTSEVENINNAQALARIKDLKPDLGVVFGTRRLKPELIELFPDGLINVHRGIAREYRGLDSEFWAAYHSDWNNIGVTLHKVDNDLDTGAIVEACRMPLKPGMTCHQLRYYTSELAIEMMIRALDAYRAGELRPTPQTTLGRYYSFIPLELKKIVQKRFDRYCETL